MATDKTPHCELDQHQSPLFRLPRELRDEIYDFYTHEDDGYVFDSTAQKLPIELALSYKCKRVATEMTGMAFRTNDIKFRTMLSSPEITDQPSNASLYEELLRAHRQRLRHMLKWAYTTVSAKVMHTLKSLHPNSLAVQRIVERVQDEDDADLGGGYLFKVWSLDDYNSDSILVDLIKLMATQSGFYHLTSKEYDLDLRRATESDDDASDPDDDDDGDDNDNDSDNDNDNDDDNNDDNNDDNDDDAFSDSNDSDSDDSSFDFDSYFNIKIPSYSRETQTDILQWRPQLWSIPNRAELEAKSNFLPPWPEAIARPVPEHEYIPNMYFSAAAVAIRFLEGLALKSRGEVRKIVIEEDHPSVASSITHAQGLIPLCQANPKIRKERRVDVWPTEFVYRSNFFSHHAKEIVTRIDTWINEVKILYQMGMPAGCFTLVLHGPCEQASQQLSDAITRAAIWLEGTVELARREQRRFYPFQGITEDFADVIKEMLRGEIPARFDAEMNEVWDIEKIISEYVGDWPSKVSDVFRLQDFEEPEEGWHAACEAYK